jgi:ABC-type antimicrobial peptide transport system permease subunit
VLRLIVGEAARLVVSGGVIGLVGAVALTRLLRTLLFGVAPIDPATFLIAPLVLGIVALLAAAVPARRAAGVDPMVALRSE